MTTTTASIRLVPRTPFTSFNRGMSLEAIAALLGHHDLSMTMVYANSRELQQTGEKPQVA
jgi:integrase